MCRAQAPAGGGGSVRHGLVPESHSPILVATESELINIGASIATCTTRSPVTLFHSLRTKFTPSWLFWHEPRFVASKLLTFPKKIRLVGKQMNFCVFVFFFFVFSLTATHGALSSLCIPIG